MSKPIAIYFTDLHIDDSNINKCMDIANQAVELAKSLGVTTVFNAGDTFNSRKSQSMSCLTAFDHILETFREAGITMYAIDGNHDKLMYNTTISYLDPYAYHPALKLIKTHEIGVIKTPKLTISMLSFFSDDNQCTSNKTYADCLKVMASVPVKGKHILITHHGFDGAKSNGGRAIESDISLKLLEPFDTVLVGHYHDRHELSKKVHYTGSCHQAWFSENKDKGFVIINDDGSFEYRQSDFKQYTELDVTLVGDYVEKISSTIKKLKTKYKDDYHRIHLIGDRASVKSVDVNSIKASGIDVRTTDITNPIIQGDHEEFTYVQFDEQKVAGLFMDFLDEEGIAEDKDIEYSTEVLLRTISKYKSNGRIL